MSELGDKLKGSAEEVAGKVTGNKKLEAKGKTKQIAGNLKDQAEKVGDEVGKKVNDVLDKAKKKTAPKK